MSHMSDISVEMQNLQADVEALRARMIVERDIANYWFERCMTVEGKLNDALNNQLQSDEGK